MKKLLFSTLALAAVVVASPVLAEDGFNFVPSGEAVPALKNSPEKPALGSENSVPAEVPAGAKPMNPEVINDPSTATPGYGEPYVEYKDGKYWGVYKFEGGENRIELKVKEYEEVNGQKYPKVGLSEEIIAGLMLGAPGSEEDKKSEENKPANKAVKDAVAAAKKDAAKKDGKKVLPNTSAVK